MARLTAAQRAQKAMWSALEAAYGRLRAAIPDPDKPGEGFPGEVITALRGIGGDAWIELDERSGYRDLGSWFSLVRQTRNSPVWGPQLIRAVNECAGGR
jgi:hypothetical protein